MNPTSATPGGIMNFSGVTNNGSYATGNPIFDNAPGANVPGSNTVQSPGASTSPVVATSNLADTATNQNIKDLSSATAPKTAAPITSAAPTQAQPSNQPAPVNFGRLTYDQAMNLFKGDFTGVRTNQDGTFSADEVAMGRYNANNPSTAVSGSPSQQPNLNTVKPDDFTQAYLKDIDTLRANLDSRTNSIIDNIKKEYDKLFYVQDIANKSYTGGVTNESIVSGRARYAPVISMGEINAAVAAGTRAMSELEVKKQTLINDALKAKDEQDFKLLDNKMTSYRAAIKDQRDAAQTMYENVIRASADARAEMENQRQQRQSDLDIETKTAENFAPSVAKQLNSLPDDQSRQKFLKEFAASHGISEATLSGVVSKYSDTINQSMKSAMYSMLAENPRAGISMDDINGNNISEVARKVMLGPDFQLKTLSEQTKIRESLANAAISEAKVRMMTDPNSVTTLAQYALDHKGQLPPGIESAMTPLILSTAQKMAPEYLPKGTIISQSGIPSDLPGQDQTAIQAGLRMMQTMSDIRELLLKVPEGPGATTVQDALSLVGKTDPAYTAVISKIGQLAQDYDVLKGGVRGGASASLMASSKKYIPDVNNYAKYNTTLLDSFEKGVISGVNDVLNTNGVSLNRTIVKPFAEQVSDISSLVDVGKSAKGSDAEIYAYIKKLGYADPAIVKVFKSKKMKYE